MTESMTEITVSDLPAPLWKVGDVAKFLNVQEDHVYRLVAQNAIPVKRIGRLLRFVPHLVRAWAERR